MSSWVCRNIYVSKYLLCRGFPYTCNFTYSPGFPCSYFEIACTKLIISSGALFSNEDLKRSSLILLMIKLSMYPCYLKLNYIFISSNFNLIPSLVSLTLLLLFIATYNNFKLKFTLI